MEIESIIQRKAGTKVELGSNLYHFLPRADGKHVANVEDQGHIAHLLAIRDGFRLANAADAAGAALELPEMEGFFFIVRGPQDMQALYEFVALVPEFEDDVAEHVLLTDKLMVGEASLGDYRLPADYRPPALLRPELPPTLENSGPVAAENSIRPNENQSQQEDDDARGGARPAAGAGGPGVAEGVGAESGGGERGPASGETSAALRANPAAPLDRETLAGQYADMFGHRPNGKWNAEKIAAAIAEKQAQG